MRILFVGDVVGAPGRRALKPALRALAGTWAPDLVVVNAENAAAGAGLTPEIADEIFKAGADVLTTGNHVWDKKQIVPYIEQQPRLLRPLNYPPPCPGQGVCVVTTRKGTPVAVMNLMGRVFMADLDDPFRAADEALAGIAGKAKTIVVDFHAEATSEKSAMGWYLDGRVTAVVGTHTHVPTADARVLPRGTAFITDVGMTGPHDSVIGVDKEVVLARFRLQRPASFTVAEGDVKLCGVVIECGADGLATSIERVEVPFGGIGPA